MTGADEIDTTELEVGDTIEMPGGLELSVAGVATSNGDVDMRHYECELAGAPDTLLYGPGDVDDVLAGNSKYLGKTEVDEEREPFICAGCRMPARESERYETDAVDVPVCCSGCERRVLEERPGECTANH